MSSARAHATHLRLIGGLVVDAAAHRADMLQRMANDLLEYDAVHDKRDAVRCLMGRREYHTLDIAMLVEDARALAFQDLVAFEMVKP